VKPAEEKSKVYSVQSLSQRNPDSWTRLENSPQVDVAYQSKKSSAVISVVSICRDTSSELRELTHQLLLGISDVRMRKERSFKLAGVPALKTTVVGIEQVSSRAERPVGPVVLQTVVLQKDDCAYELLSVSTPEAFPKVVDDFSHFVASFRWVS
jgi:hypothetical protein